MPVYSPDKIEKLSADIFGAAGAPADIASHVARSLVESNLLGHDSHGVLRIPSYLESIERGTTLPAARPSIVQETDTTASVDGNLAFGQISAHFATIVGIEKARARNVAAVAVSRCNHIGRLGEYTELAARQGMFAFMAGGTYNSGAVTPYGGASRVLGTNPISFALPAPGDQPVIADIATSVAAEGKLRVARAKGQPVAPGTILDKNGNPSTDPNDYYAGGVLLTFGGHKGYVLSVIGDLLARHIAAGELAAPDGISFSNFLVVVNVEAFRPLVDFEGAADARLREIKGAKPAPGFDEVMLPGEPERRTRAKRVKEGIALPEDTVNQLSQIATSYGLSMPDPKG